MFQLGVEFCPLEEKGVRQEDKCAARNKYLVTTGIRLIPHLDSLSRSQPWSKRVEDKEPRSPSLMDTARRTGFVATDRQLFRLIIKCARVFAYAPLPAEILIHMSYTRLDLPSTSHHPSNNTSNFLPSQSRPFLMRIPQLFPREPKNTKISNKRKRQLLLSYLPDW